MNRCAGDFDDPHNGSTTRFRQGGVVPYDSLDRTRADYPLLRFPWRDVRQTLSELASITPLGSRVHLAYVNPETGRECMNTLGFSALMLRPGEELRLPRRSASSVFHAVEGQGTATVDGVDMAFGECDTFAAPNNSKFRSRPELDGDIPIWPITKGIWSTTSIE